MPLRYLDLSLGQAFCQAERGHSGQKGVMVGTCRPEVLGFFFPKRCIYLFSVY